eukprot:6196482-Pleurochrysis_carterae.AAC.2
MLNVMPPPRARSARSLLRQRGRALEGEMLRKDAIIDACEANNVEVVDEAIADCNAALSVACEADRSF